MAKRLMFLMGMLAMLLGAAVPALAESAPELTGVIEKPEVTSYMYGTHAMADEVGGDPYALESDVVDLDAYVGQRVTVSGTFAPGFEDGQVEGGPPLFDVTHVEPVQCPQQEEEYQYGQNGCPIVEPPGEEIEVTFELAVEGEPPADTSFFGTVGQQPAELTDPDGDGVYASPLTLSADFGTFPIPVGIIAGDPATPQYTIEDFGEVMLEDGDVFSASVSYDGTGPVDPAPVVDVDGDGEVDASDGEEAAEVSDSARTTGGARVLPDTGGVALVLLGAGALLSVAGLLVRGATR